jgi:hypothetical protein
MTRPPWPGHESAVLRCTDYIADRDIGELSPRHRLLVRGVCVDGPRLWFYYTWKPGLTESMGADSGVWLTVQYGADVPPANLDYVGFYDTSGGPASDGEICYASPPPSAQRIWFDFWTTSDESEVDPPAGRLTIELATAEIRLDRASPPSG